MPPRDLLDVSIDKEGPCKLPVCSRRLRASRPGRHRDHKSVRATYYSHLGRAGCNRETRGFLRCRVAFGWPACVARDAAGLDGFRSFYTRARSIRLGSSVRFATFMALDREHGFSDLWGSDE